VGPEVADVKLTSGTDPRRKCPGPDEARSSELKAYGVEGVCEKLFESLPETGAPPPKREDAIPPVARYYYLALDSFFPVLRDVASSESIGDFCGQQENKGMNKLRIGIVGLGPIAQNAHLLLAFLPDRARPKAQPAILS
jgi:hypothetical protein